MRIPLTRNLETLVDAEDYEWLIKQNWFASKDRSGLTYACSWKRVEGKRKEIRMHRIIMEKYRGGDIPAGLQVDHINRDSLDNRKANLRLCTQRENLLNKGDYKNNTSGEKGVYWDKGTNKWRAAIRRNGTLHYLGIYDDFTEAKTKYEIAAKEMIAA